MNYREAKMRLPLTALEVFAAIARHGSLRAAANALGIKPSTVSHQLKSLEDQLGAPLFIRTTRSISLTEAGRALIRGAGPAFEQLAGAVESARTSGHAARGTLKLTIPEFAYRLVVGPALASFCATYPEIEVELSLTDALTDILDDELHAGFRLGDRIAQDMVAVRMTPPLALTVAASPYYLSAVGHPKTPEDLLDHSCIRYRYQPSGHIAPWSFHTRDGEISVDVRGHLIADSLPVLVDLATQGAGLIYTFHDYVAEEFATGTLLPVLERHMPETQGIFLYFPREYRDMVPLRLLLDHLTQQGSSG
ncbi:LysR family transcriptional regulator [Halomonas binhaiensis]|uniref:LysR family transcriptional regulator n=1 Tax=Halomonas binhaiensis TaxID=2562282 RepID=A0A856QVC4_9GAMM|nr:LysR family transcriptional regulator [Halomonas binhaiensis]QEM83843.2 LysR family transcriptional regulator [Halomonas binhaiensis]